ncbi:COP1-interactive protein 1-like [Impatiens glandulifera]|uniref:COP1-interactive protein 1-like n=1 Tax=Impatiens glandulifera TaxID=253017 RepID=UPI001FB19C90|nr:COP1-interactive protein 1-like [Impatiens glandulifera]
MDLTRLNYFQLLFSKLMEYEDIEVRKQEERFALGQMGTFQNPESGEKYLDLQGEGEHVLVVKEDPKTKTKCGTTISSLMCMNRRLRSITNLASLAWQCILSRGQIVEWHHSVWSSRIIPRHQITLWLVHRGAFDSCTSAAAATTTATAAAMVKRNRAAKVEERSVYFDTSLDTHILLTVSDSDTVSDIRKKIVHEHLRCFPIFGPIEVHALKVKRKGNFYHLSESMLVRCAFEGVTKSWFLSVDASSLNRLNALEPLSLDTASKEKGFALLKEPKNDLAISGKAGTLGTLGKDVDCKEDDSGNKIGYVQFNSPEEALKPSPRGKKQKRRRKSLQEHNNEDGAVQPSHFQEVTENDYALVIYDGSNNAAEFVPEETLLCPIVPLNVEQPKVPASTGIDTNGIANATANDKSNTSKVGATIGSKERKHTKKKQSRDQGILASPSFHGYSNADKRGAEIGSEDKDPSNDKTNKKRKLPSNHAISSQDAADRQNNEVIVKDSKNSTPDERPRKRSKKSVAPNPDLSSMEDAIGKGKIAIDEAHNTGEKKEISFGDREKFDPSHQNDTNGYVKEVTSSAEFLGTNKGKELEKSNNGKKLKKSTKRSVVVKADALSLENDCILENKTDEKIEAGAHNTGERREIAFDDREMFDPSHQNDTNGYVKEAKSSAEIVGTNKGKESEKSNNGKKLKKSTKRSVVVKANALSMDNDCILENKTDEKIEAEAHNTGERKEISFGDREKFDPSHQNDTNGYVKDATSSAEVVGTNKGKESEKSNNGKKLKKSTKRSVVVKANALSMDNDCILENKTDEKIEAEAHNTGERKEISFGDREKFDPSHQNDTNGYVKDATSSAEVVGTNKGKESEKSNNGKKLKKSTKRSVVVKENALSMENDCILENKTDEKIEAPNEKKDHEIMLSEEAGPELPIGKAVATFNSEANEVKELENTITEQRKNLKAKKSVAQKPSASIMVNDNLQSEISLTDHANKTYKKEELHREDDPDRQIKEVGSAELNDTNNIREPVKSITEKTKKKRSIKLVAVNPATTSEKNANSMSDVYATDLTYKSDERRELPDDDEAMLSERGDAPIRKEAESLLANQVIEAPEENPKNSVSLKKVKMTQSSSNVNLKEQSPIDFIAKDAGSKDEKVGKKMKKHKVLNVKSHPDLPSEVKEVASQVFNPQSDTFVQEEASGTEEHSKSLKSGPENQLAGRVLEEDSNSNSADLSSTLQETAINSNLKSEGNSLNFKDYFVSEANRSNDQPKVTKEKKRPSRDLSSSDIQFQEASSKVEPKSMSKGISESRKLHQIKIVPEEAGLTDTNGLEMRSPALANLKKKNTESSRVPISRSETSERHLQNIEKSSRQAEVSKASRNKIGKIINSSQNKKSLLARSGTIFRDASSESSKDDNGKESADSSTKSPSDSSSSSSSAYSDASNFRSSSQRNESFSIKGKESGRKNINELRTPASKKLSLDTILKSSSRFKKARLTAVESQLEDSESQPVDIVPESQV